MKKCKVHYTVEARWDLDEIWDYIVLELQNIPAAERVVNGILDAADRLEDFAEMGTLLSAIANVDSDYRFLISGKFMVFYRISGTDVYVDRILYGRRDYLRILFGDMQETKTKTTE